MVASKLGATGTAVLSMLMKKLNRQSVVSCFAETDGDTERRWWAFVHVFMGNVQRGYSVESCRGRHGWQQWARSRCWSVGY
jgi:hypothetical protein